MIFSENTFVAEKTSIKQAIELYKNRIDNANFSINALSEINDYDGINNWKIKKTEYEKILSWLKELDDIKEKGD